MMRWMLLSLMLVPVVGLGQSVTVTGTVTDADGQAWSNANVRATLVLPSGPFGNVLATAGGATVIAKTNGVTSGTGTFSLSLAETSTLDQPGGVWQITVCPNVSYTPNSGTGCVTARVAIKGTSDISSQFSGITAPRLPAGPGAFAYNDFELIPPAIPGTTYYNVGTSTALQGLRLWSGKMWTGVLAGGSNVPPAGADGTAPVSESGAYVLQPVLLTALYDQPSGVAPLNAVGEIPSVNLTPQERNAAYGGTAAGISADATTGADSGISESFYADFTCYPTTTTTGTGSTATTTTTYSTPQGWDYANGHSCLQGFVQPLTSGTFMSLARSMQFTGGDQPQATQFTVTARMKYLIGSNVGASIGFNSAPEKTVSTSAALHVLLTLTSNGWVLDNQGTITQLQPTNGSSSGVHQITDSGPNPSGGYYGWNPEANGTYDATLMIPGDGTIMVSIVALGSPQNSVSFRLTGQTLPTCASPCGTRGAAAGLQNVEVDAFGGADRIGEVAYSIGGPRPTSYDIPHRSGYYNGGMMLRWPVTGNLWAWIPPGYMRNAANKWAIVSHGFGEDSQVVQTEYLQVTNLLMQQGYVIVALDNNTPNGYGNADNINDIKTALATVRASLSLAPQPYMLADSMGGFQMLNSVAMGAITPKALVGFCINTNLGWDYTAGGAATPITADYGISASNPYATATAGYDPLLATGMPLDRLTAVPMLLFSSPGDTVVLKSQNTDPFAAKINSAGGSVTVVQTTGNHLDQSNFNGPLVLSFLGSN